VGRDTAGSDTVHRDAVGGRDTVGVGAVAGEATSGEPAEGLRAVAALRRLADKLEVLHVRRARALGWSWQEIADQMGVTRQTVHKKHAGRQDEG